MKDSNDVPDTTGERIRKERLARRMSQKKLGKKLNLSQQKISAIELHDEDLSFRAAQKIRKMFGVSLSYLAMESDKRNE